MDKPSANKALIEKLQKALYDYRADGVREVLAEICAPDLIVHQCFPFGDIQGASAYFDQVIFGLAKAIPDLERRDYILIAGETSHGEDWVGCGGYYTGTFSNPWLDIPPTGHMASMRFHEFYKVENNRIVEIQALWDIPELMLQAQVWPMPPSLGREWHVPGPATLDGIQLQPYDETTSARSVNHVVSMLQSMQRHPLEGGPELMEMDKYWHTKMSWYGPSGIGTCRGIEGFRNWHQKPFLNSMPDRGQYPEKTQHHFFGDGQYVGVTGWPNMAQTLSGAGWLGIPPVNKEVTLRSLDFWRLEQGKIRENWVLVDLLDLYDQIGVDVLGRMREFNKSGFPGGCGQAIEASV